MLRILAFLALAIAPAPAMAHEGEPAAHESENDELEFEISTERPADKIESEAGMPYVYENDAL